METGDHGLNLEMEPWVIRVRISLIQPINSFNWGCQPKLILYLWKDTVL